jgi:hypothetical protein
VIDEQADSIFTRLYTTKQGIVRSAVRSHFKGMDDGIVDVEGLCTDVWTQVLQALRSDGFEERGDRESNAWLRMKARGVASDWRDKYQRHFKKALENKADMESGGCTFAVMLEDQWEATPSGPNPHFDEG